MWIYVFLGNMLRGIGETPVMPLGVSYLDDFAREENAAFYLCKKKYGTKIDVKEKSIHAKLRTIWGCVLSVSL